ncbi:MAG: hypothetical protein ACR2LQ_05420 [Acidimicrobiales bacterium]
MKRLFSLQVLRLRGRALREGVLGGNSRWFALYGVMATAKLVRRLIASKPVIERFELAPGQTIVITELAGSEQFQSRS